MKYTKGKWDMSTHSDNTDIIIRSQNGIIANCTIDAWPEMSKIEKEANAKLIAAAPDLLITLERFNRVVMNLADSAPTEYKNERNDLFADVHNIHLNVIEIIKKATE